MTKEITRRTALSGIAGALALAPIAGAAAATALGPHPDAELLALEPEWRARNAAANAKGLPEEEREAACDSFLDVEYEIAEREALTLDGVALKLRVAVQRHLEFNTLDTPDADLVVTALEAVTRIAAGGAS